ncbi:lytic transglycosylase domain-containing protein [Antarcticimicrobium sediminis]|uniref:Lytic transglycosylase domain-containing protein n=1 Tax=Antarcticimicrobium sediminis TaxID=2546227 RepID=A0A4R5EY12_9RHOB|nr:lytic transglycosylase domain-containing protein [Antarcticimicrobium sediminis]TDE39687.1 lytic transglycosylase domain-containing protein [Antarcticimicrobium sediminis]
MRLRVIAAAVAAFSQVFLGGPVRADPAAPFPEFQARRVKPPAPGTARRINVQIDPEEQQRRAAVPKQQSTTAGADPDATPTAKASLGRYDWFWEGVSPDLAQSSPARLHDALQLLSGAQKVAAPRLQALQEIARARGIPILTATVGTQVSPALVLAVISVESAGKPDAVSGAGAQGLMQLMPDTAARFGVSDSLVPEDNIAGGVKYLDWLMQKFDNDPILVLAGYNAGAGAVRDHAGVPPFAETRDYVPKVLAAFQVARGLCLTPPELISDGCVFAALN